MCLIRCTLLTFSCKGRLQQSWCTVDVFIGGLMNEDDEESIMNQLVKVVEERSNLVALIEEDRLK